MLTWVADTLSYLIKKVTKLATGVALANLTN